MKTLRFTLIFIIMCKSSVVLALDKDALTELASSENLNEILKANRQADHEEILKMACQKQIDEKLWPTSCFDWLDYELKLNRISNRKKTEWSHYLERFCFRLAAKPTVTRSLATNSKLWQKSKCFFLAKKFGSNLEDNAEE